MISSEVWQDLKQPVRAALREAGFGPGFFTRATFLDSHGSVLLDLPRNAPLTSTALSAIEYSVIDDGCAKDGSHWVWSVWPSFDAACLSLKFEYVSAPADPS